MRDMNLIGLAVAGTILGLTGITPSAQAQIAPPARVDIYTNMPQVDPGDDPANWSARQNVADSQRYEHLTRTNPTFRAARIQKECGPISEPGLHQQCVASFGD